MESLAGGRVSADDKVGPGEKPLDEEELQQMQAVNYNNTSIPHMVEMIERAVLEIRSLRSRNAALEEALRIVKVGLTPPLNMVERAREIIDIALSVSTEGDAQGGGQTTPEKCRHGITKEICSGCPPDCSSCGEELPMKDGIVGVCPCVSNPASPVKCEACGGSVVNGRCSECRHLRQPRPAPKGGRRS